MSDVGTKDTSSGTRRPLLVASVIVILLAGLELIGWICGWQQFAAGVLRYVPMAPSTAICFIALTLNWLLDQREDSGRGHLVRSISIILFVMVYCGLVLLEQWRPTALHIEDLLLPHSGFLNGVPLARMSPLTSGLFLLSGGAMLLRLIGSTSRGEHYSLGNLSGLFGSIVAFAGFTILLGYAYGTPFLYGRGIVPVAATTAAAFLFMGSAVVIRLNPDDIPLRYFLSPRIQSRLVRTFAPLVFFAVVLQGVVDRFAPLFVDVNNALLSALLAAGIAVLAMIATSKTASMAGNAIDQAEEAVRQSEQTLRSLVDANPEALFMIDIEGIVLVANEEVARRVGTTSRELIGSCIYDFLPVDLAQARKEQVREAIVTGKPVRFEDTRLDRTIDNHLQPIFDEQGMVVSVAILGIDITNQRKAEEVQRRLSTAIEQSVEIVVITDADGVIQYVNPATEQITGFERSEIIGNNPRIFKSGEHDSAFYEQLWNTITAGKVWSGRIINKKKDGSLYYEDATISPVRDASGKIINFVAVKRDVTEHLELSSQLFQAQKMEAIGTLAGGVAHDFNNLLTVVMGYSELLLAEKDEKDSSYEDIQRINEAARKGADLVQGLLAFSRKSDTRPRPLNVNRQIEQIQKMLIRTIPKMIEIELNLADGLSPVSADPARIDQVLMNLALNAKDAMPDKGKLTIETANVFLDEEYARMHLGAKPGEYVLLSVSDTGYGMDKETLSHIFEPFYTTKEAGKGTGLGLAMVYGIINQHGGQIRCYSEPGQGTTFKIYLPALVAEKEQLELDSRKSLPSGGTETVLLVDDEEFVRDLGKMILERSGYTVLTAANGKEALDVYNKERGRISLVILDLIMPEMGGRQCLEEILKIDPGAPVLIASGFAPNGQTAETLETGARGFVGKPYDMRQMLHAIRGALDGSC